MQIPSNVVEKFYTKVYSCKATTLQEEQRRKKKLLFLKLSKIKDECLERNINDIHPNWIKQKKIEKFSQKIIDHLLNKIKC